jgi:flagellar protein FlaG
MSTNLPIGGFNVSSGNGKIPTIDGLAVKPSTGVAVQTTGEAVQTTKELKQAQLEGKNIPISEEQLVKAIDRAIKAAEGTSTTLEFSVHEKTKHIIVKVINKDTGEVIREIPGEKTLDFLAKIWHMAGALVDERR